MQQPKHACGVHCMDACNNQCMQQPTQACGVHCIDAGGAGDDGVLAECNLEALCGSALAAGTADMGAAFVLGSAFGGPGGAPLVRPPIPYACSWRCASASLCVMLGGTPSMAFGPMCPHCHFL